MMINNKARRVPTFFLDALIVFIATASLVSCEDFFNSVFDTAAPTSLKASDGKYANHIEVRWSAPSLSSENWEGQSVTGYVIEWIGSDALASGTENLLAHQTSYTINVGLVNRAKEYHIEVTTLVDGQEEGSSSDTGFAIETFDLIWEDGGAVYSFSGTDRWYVTMLQKGFRYDFAFLAGKTGWIEFYDYGTLNKVHDTRNTEPNGAKNLPSWVCNEDGAWHKFYVRVVPSVPAVAPAETGFQAQYGF